LIAKWYTGRTENWETILDHNPTLNVHKMRMGDVVHIPEYLLIKRDEMPKAYVAKFYSENKTEQSREAADPSLAANAGGESAKTPLPSLHTEEATAQSGTVSNSKSIEGLGPPEKTLPEAGLNVAKDEAGAQNPAQHSKSRDALLNELLSDDSESGAAK